MKVAPLSRALVLCQVLAWCLLLPLTVRAQDAGVSGDGGGVDAGGVFQLPDGSVGSGGADRDNPEGEDDTGRPGGSCRGNLDCPTRFSCSQGACRYSGIREAERVGCLLGPENTLGLVGLGLVLATRRRGGGRR